MDAEHTSHIKGRGQHPCTYEPTRLGWNGFWGADGILQERPGAAGLQGEERPSEEAVDGVWVGQGPEHPWESELALG